MISSTTLSALLHSALLVANQCPQNDEAKLEKEHTPIPVVVMNAATAVVAGSDTTATTLSSIAYFLLSNPACFSRLRAEIDEAFPPGVKEPTDTTVLAQMPYLNAVM